VVAEDSAGWRMRCMHMKLCARTKRRSSHTVGSAHATALLKINITPCCATTLQLIDTCGRENMLSACQSVALASFTLVVYPSPPRLVSKTRILFTLCQHPKSTPYVKSLSDTTHWSWMAMPSFTSISPRLSAATKD
jgi:hypothetical protein